MNIRNILSSLKSRNLERTVFFSLVFAIPHGFAQITIMDELNIDIGFTTKEAASKLGQKADSIFKLPRWDTNNCWDSKWRRPCSPC